MISFDSTLENFVDGVDFTADDPCIWIVYPGGAAGDMLASIVNFHYVNTGSRFYGINKSGQVIFRSSDSKISNNLSTIGQFEITDDFFYEIATRLGEKNLNYSLLDQFIFANHAYREDAVNKVLNNFKNCSIIRILPRTWLESETIGWMSSYKNLNSQIKLPDLDGPDLGGYSDTVTDSRLLNVYFGELLSPSGFEKAYTRIVQHLGLPGKLVRYDFVQYWLDQQSKLIQPALKKIIQEYNDTN